MALQNEGTFVGAESRFFPDPIDCSSYPYWMIGARAIKFYSQRSDFEMPMHVKGWGPVAFTIQQLQDDRFRTCASIRIIPQLTIHAFVIFWVSMSLTAMVGLCAINCYEAVSSLYEYNTSF